MSLPKVSAEWYIDNESDRENLSHLWKGILYSLIERTSGLTLSVAYSLVMVDAGFHSITLGVPKQFMPILNENMKARITAVIKDELSEIHTIYFVPLATHTPPQTLQ